MHLFLCSPEAAAQLPRRLQFEAMLDLLQEIDAFKNSSVDEHRFKRLQMILRRYTNDIPGKDTYGRGSLASLEVLKSVRVKVECHPEIFQIPPADLFDIVASFVMEVLEADFFPCFSKSSYFKGLVASVSNTATTLDRTESLNRWMENAGLVHESTQTSVVDTKQIDGPATGTKKFSTSFKHSLLPDTIGLFFFQKFCTCHFQEESILFYLEVQHLRDWGRCRCDSTDTLTSFKG